MIWAQKVKLVTKEKSCFNCLEKNHNDDKCSSKNKCSHVGCAEYHHAWPHNYFNKNVDDADEENTKACIYTKQCFFRLCQSEQSQKTESLYQHMHCWIVEWKCLNTSRLFEEARSRWKNKVAKHQQCKRYWRNHKSKRG